MKLVLFLLISMTCLAQDEWVFRDILNKNTSHREVKEEKVHYQLKSKAYSLDLNGDGVEEYLMFEIKDAVYWMYVFDRKGKKILSHRFTSYGYGSHVFKIVRRKFSKDHVATLLYFFDGKTGYLEKKGTATLYSILGRRDNREKFKFQKIASIWMEHLKKENYIRRLYEVNFDDVNYDGNLDLVVMSGNVTRNFFLINDEWKKY